MITEFSVLQENIDSLANETIGSLAQRMGCAVPDDLQHHKGWLGQLIERALGADAGCQSKPDFSQLGIELKTVPVNRQMKPLESTYVCTVPLSNLGYLTYENSVVNAKLSHVLWVPILTEGDGPIHERPILQPRLWKPNEDQLNTLRTDFEELMDLIALGELSRITASMGTYLHIRPKAATGRVLTQGVGLNGHLEPTLPRGFYLRSQFTTDILRG